MATESGANKPLNQYREVFKSRWGTAATVAGSPYLIVPSTAVGTGLGNYNISYINGVLTATSLHAPFTIGVQVTLGNGTIQLIFMGGDNGVSYRVQGISDLTSTNWMDLVTNVATSSGLPGFIDLDATNHLQRFYRTITP